MWLERPKVDQLQAFFRGFEVAGFIFPNPFQNTGLNGSLPSVLLEGKGSDPRQPGVALLEADP